MTTTLDHTPSLCTPTPAGLPVVIAAHGTRDPEGVAVCEALVDRVRGHLPGVQVRVGYVELVDPPIADALASTLQEQIEQADEPRAVVLPLMLGAGCHAEKDIPEAIAEGLARVPGAHASYGRTLGHDPRLLTALGERLRAAAADWDLADTAVVVVGRGTSHPRANADHVALARLLFEANGVAHVVPAFIQVAQPDVAAALDQAAALGHRKVVVLPNFLFPGMLRTWLREQSQAWADRTGYHLTGPGQSRVPEATEHIGQVRLAEVIGDCPALAEVVADRYREIAGNDLCCAQGRQDHAPAYLTGLRLAGKTVLVVGGGRVAERRVPRLLDAGATVRLVSPTVTPRLEKISRTGSPHAALEWHRRTFAPTDVDGVWYVLAATDDPQVNEQVTQAAEACHTFCVRADCANAGSAWTPAVEHAGGLTVAVIGDRDPRGSAQVRDALLRALHDCSENPRQDAS
ncbi:Siroheme synthase [Austwickia sp. TVS 96-490-7B]|uniref:CbiX/SirB N-terminal domain-containing protein n=1 Tax=Austwickia sp. TVS 96-490-7B TaxID=2830843 RepID=UPI001C579FDE|nr:CbiX/SirB N-terminal domain-containing protein [Austwickia sp. TVS 96-490-7B]MBW3084978.1 Siroheme synthase [Austwickia sp. TVS 96-490-7B]